MWNLNNQEKKKSPVNFKSLVSRSLNCSSVPFGCSADRPSAPCWRLRALPRGFPDCRDGGRHAWNLAAALSRDGSYPRWHGDHFHHSRWLSAKISFPIFSSDVAWNNQLKKYFLTFFSPSAAEKTTRGKSCFSWRKSGATIVDSVFC